VIQSAGISKTDNVAEVVNNLSLGEGPAVMISGVDRGLSSVE
jgi:hypothetical protein